MYTPQDPTEIENSAPPSIILILHELENPRIKRARKHHLTDILFIALCTMICGGESFEHMEEFGSSKQHWLSRYLELTSGIPSHDTFNRIFQLLNPRSFQDTAIKLGSFKPQKDANLRKC